jgi:hypothetical protein
MEMLEQLENIIASVGFPVAMCIILLYQNHEMRKENTENLKILNETMQKLLLEIQKIER